MPFDPNKPFESLDKTKEEKKGFDPSKPFEAVEEAPPPESAEFQGRPLKPEDLQRVQGIIESQKSPAATKSELTPEDFWKIQKQLEAKRAPMTQGEVAAQGLVEGASLGLAAPLTKAIFPVDPERFDELAAAQKAEAQKEFPKTYEGSKLAGSVAATLPLGLGASAAASGVEALAESEDPMSLQGLEEAGTAAAGTLVGGKVAQGLLGLGSKVAGKVAKGAGEGAETAAAKALGAGKRMQKQMGPEKTRKLGREAIERDIVSTFGSTKKMIKKVEEIKDNAAQAFETTAKAIEDSGIKINPKEMAAKINRNISELHDDPDLARTLAASIEDISKRGGSVEGLRKLKTKFADKGWTEQNTLVNTEKGRMYRDIWRELQDQYYQEAARVGRLSGDRTIIQNLDQANKDWAFQKQALRALGDRLSSEQGNKTFGLTDTIMAAGALQQGFAPMAALVGAKKAAEAVGGKVKTGALESTRKLLERAQQARPVAQTTAERVSGQLTPEQAKELLKRLQEDKEK